MKLKIDNREKNLSRPFVMEKCDELGISYEFDNLVVGDYLWCDHGIGIEMKRIDDFAASLPSGRLDSQIVALKQYPHPLIVVYGELYYIGKRSRGAMSRSMFMSKLTSIAVREGVPAIVVDTPEQAAEIIMNAPKYAERGSRSDGVEVVRHPTIAGGKQDASLTAYVGLRGVGADKARELRKRYGTFYEFLLRYKSANRDLLSGKITKKEYHEMFPANLITKTTRGCLDEI